MKKFFLVISTLVLAGLAYKFDVPGPQTKQIPTPTLNQTPIPSPTPKVSWEPYSDSATKLSFTYPRSDRTRLSKLDPESASQLLYLHIFPDTNNTDTYINIEVYSGDRTLLPTLTPTPEVPSEYISWYERVMIGKIPFEKYTIEGNCRPLTYQTVKNNRTFVFQEVCGPITGFADLIKSVSLQ